jgi:AcrR family transcriptional regulator
MPAPRRLSLDAIVDAAVEVLAADGPAAVTMRRLADDLGVGVMTLYGYVRTKEEIFSAVFDRGIAGIPIPARRTAPWPDVARQIFGAVFDALTEHPELRNIVVTQPMEGAAARAATEAMEGALRDAGLSAEAARAAFDALANYTFGAAQRSTRESYAEGLELVIAGIGATSPG